MRKQKLTAKCVKALKSEVKKYRVWDTEINGFHIRVSPEGRKAYALSYRYAGQPKEYTIGTHGNVTTDSARTIATKLMGRVADGVDIQEAKKSDKRKAEADKYKTLGEFIELKYKPWALSELKTAKDSLRTLNVDFRDYHAKKLVDITPWIIESWIRDVKGRGLAAATVNRRVTVLKAVLSKAVEWGVIEESPLRGLKRQKVDPAKKVRYLSVQEEKRLRNALDNRQQDQSQKRLNFNKWRKDRKMEPLPELNGLFTDYLKPLVLVALNTGMRRGELFNLLWRDIDLKSRSLAVDGSGAKTGGTRHIPLNTEAFATLVAWRNQTEYSDHVFPSQKTGGRLDNISSSWEKLREDAKLSNFRFHDLRHDFASKLVMAGVDLNTVRELLGHSTIEMTLRYAHLAPEHKAAAVALLNAQ